MVLLPCESRGDQYHAIPKEKSGASFRSCEALADRRCDSSFVGRLATYRYDNMDQVVGQALATGQELEETAPARPAYLDRFLP